MGLEPVIHTRRKTSELAAEVERLATMSVAERLAERYLFLDWLSTSMSESLPQAGWAMDGDAALLAHGVPAAPDRFQIAIVDDPEVIAACDRLRESPTNDSEFRLVSELPPTRSEEHTSELQSQF